MIGMVLVVEEETCMCGGGVGETVIHPTKINRYIPTINPRREATRGMRGGHEENDVRARGDRREKTRTSG